MSAKSKSSGSGKETVLLRQAQPKYSFQGRKLPKDPSQKNSKTSSPNSVTTKDTSSAASKTLHTPPGQGLVSNSQTLPRNIQPTGVASSKPVAVVGASFQSSSSQGKQNNSGNLSFCSNQQSQIGDISTNLLSEQSHFLSGTSTSNFAGASGANNPNVVDARSSLKNGNPVSISSGASSTSSHSQMMQPNLSFTPSGANNEALKAFNTVPNLESSQTSSPLTNESLLKSASQSQLVKFTVGEPSDSEYIRSLEQDRDKLKQDLDVQLQVNTELKRLLVASVGEDLSQRVERLCRDRAQLSNDLGGVSKKMTEDYENLDKVSIQADMWRSKYLASRVMAEELGNARAYYSLQWHDTQDALQQMLNERHELRTNLLEAHKVLQQVKNAFDPLNSHRSSSLRSTNVLDLSRSCQQQADAVRFRLLPANVSVNVGTEVNEELWENSVTRAEQYAHEVLSRPNEPVGSIQSGSSRLLPVTSQESFIKRFHPHTRHDNLTFNCCDRCKGEINVI